MDKVKGKINLIYFCLICLMVLSACSGRTQSTFHPLNRPIDIQSFENTIQIDGRQIYVLAVLDQLNKGLAFINSQSRDFIDLIESDEAPMTLVPMAGNPVAMATEETQSNEMRVWMIENENNRMYAVDFIQGTNPRFEFVDLSVNREGLYTRAIFENAGRGIVETLNQAPDVHDFMVDSDSACQSWEATYDSKLNSYRIISSKTGEQDAQALENSVFTSDDGLHSFIIEPGSLDTSNNDQLTWFTCSASYLDLSGDAVDIHIIDDQAFVLLNNSPKIDVFDLNTLSFTSSIPIPGAASVKNATVQGGAWFIPDTELDQVYRFDFSMQSVESIPLPNKVVSAVEVGTDTLLLALKTEEKLLVYNTNSQTIEKQIFMPSYINGLMDYSDTGQDRVLAYSRSGTVDAIDISSLSRVDFSRSSGDKESFVQGNIEFYDTGSFSEPELIGLSTQDGVTRSESWQLIYEGSVSNLVALDANVSGSSLDIVGFDFSQSNVSEGDKVVLYSAMGQETRLINQIVDADTLELNNNSTFSGSVTVTVKANDSYIVKGSISGEQSTRAIENQAYSSDQGDLTFLIRSSNLYPSTSGDFFSFRTNDGINSMDTTDLNLRSNISNALYLDNAISNRNEAYLIQEATGRVLLINLDEDNLVKTIR
ncbi:hypothetical protein MRY82_09545 [bacterium]|nr:hypothetical protein [bacterium]